MAEFLKGNLLNMKPKYDIGDKVWVVEANYDGEDIYKPDFVTIEKIEELTKINKHLFGGRLEIGSFIYKTKEGGSFWKPEDRIFLSEEETLEAITQSKQMLEMEKQLESRFGDLLKRGIRLSDGIYDLDGIEFIVVDGNSELGIEWIEAHKEFWIADAYETDFPILLSKEPRCLNSKKWNKENWIGSGFNYGSTNIIKNCPKDILILAEND